MLDNTQQHQPCTWSVQAMIDEQLAGLEGTERTQMIDILIAACEKYVADLDMSETATPQTKVSRTKTGAEAAQPKKRANAPKLGEVVLTKEAEMFFLNQAIGKIKTGRIAELNPLVGDSACQLTALAVVDIARKLATTDELSRTEAQILINNEILTLAKVGTHDAIGNIIKESRSESSLSDIPGILDADQYNKPARERFNIAVVTHYVADRISHLTDVLASDSKLGELLSLINNPLNQQPIQRSKSYSLNCLPCAASCEAVLMSELVRGNPILITVKRMTRTILADNMQSLRVQGIETFMFKPNAAKDNFEFYPTPTLEESQVPCVHLLGNSIINTGASTLPHLNSPSFEAYKDEFVTINIMDQLRLCYVAHKQFPGLSKSKASFEQVTAPATPGSFTAMFQSHMNNVRSGTSGIPENTMLLPEQRAGVYSCDEMTFAIDHIHADNLVYAKASDASLREQVCGKEVIASYSR